MKKSVEKIIKSWEEMKSNFSAMQTEIFETTSDCKEKIEVCLYLTCLIQDVTNCENKINMEMKKKQFKT